MYIHSRQTFHIEVATRLLVALSLFCDPRCVVPRVASISAADSNNSTKCLYIISTVHRENFAVKVFLDDVLVSENGEKKF